MAKTLISDTVWVPQNFYWKLDNVLNDNVFKLNFKKITKKTNFGRNF